MDKNRSQAIEWLKAAHDDLESIGYILDVAHLTNIVAYHAQQVVEKSLKALMEYERVVFPKTHNLERLYRYVEQIVEIDYEMLELVNELYIDSRYPGDTGLLPQGKPTTQEAKRFYDFAADVFDAVCVVIKVDRSEFILTHD